MPSGAAVDICQTSIATNDFRVSSKQKTHWPHQPLTASSKPSAHVALRESAHGPSPRSRSGALMSGMTGKPDAAAIRPNRRDCPISEVAAASLKIEHSAP